MEKKVFISYSHKDDAYRETFGDHLKSLVRNRVITVWHDRKITPGDEWAGRIEAKLESADIIIFLVSPGFLGSDYCNDVEVMRALQRHELGAAVVIPIVIRPCGWKDSEFHKLQALPKDAHPIVLWPNEDSAWLNVIDGLKAAIDNFAPVLVNPMSLVVAPVYGVSPNCAQWLEDTEIVLTHRKVDKVRLGDIYVLPDVELEKDYREREVEPDYGSAESLYLNSGRYLMLGEEQQGKTSFLKKAFTELAKNEYMPIYLDVAGITSSDVDKLVQKAVESQYTGVTSEVLLASDKRVLLLDNLDEIGLNNKYKDVFIGRLNERFDWVIATCHPAFGYIRGEVDQLNDYVAANLLGFGNLKREQIIKKWISLGVEETIEDSVLYQKCDDLKNHLNTVIKRNIVPPKPIYVLILMQMFEAYSQQNIELTSYGHCYQQLIYRSFEQAKINGKDYEKFLNVLTEISWSIFLRREGLTAGELKDFFDRYEATYLSVDRDDITSKLKDHSILAERSGRINFKYPYIYYFFVGKKIAEAFSESDEVKAQVDGLLADLHREDYANILIFITHHTKDSWLLTKIKNTLSGLFAEQGQATLTKDQLSFMDDFMKLIPELVLEQREVQKERDNQNRSLDQIERSAEPEPPEKAAADILANINQCFKGMEIAGQIIRNRHATMPRDSISELANCGMTTGLRFLDYFICMSNTSKSEIIKFISKSLSEDPGLSDKEIQGHAEGIYLHMTYGVINGVVRKIASSIGSKEAGEIYKELSDQEGSPAFTLINQAIELKFRRELDPDSIQKTSEKLRNNPVCIRILREIVIQHIYLYPVEYKAKQQLSKILGISVQGQHQMDLRKIGKGSA